MATAQRTARRRQIAGIRKYPEATPAPAKGSWRVFGFLALLAILIIFLPNIVAKTPLLGWGLKIATGSLSGSVSVRSASLSWFSPPSIEGVEVKDSEGKPVLAMKSAGAERSLAGLLWNYSNLGRLRLESPKLSLVLRDDGSNVEDLLEKYLTPKPEEKPKSATTVGFSLEIIDGSLTVTDARTERTWPVERLSAVVEMPQGTGGPVTAKLTCELPDARRPGKLAADVKMAGGVNEAALKSENVPLAMFRPLAARFVPDTVCDGYLASNVKATWGGQKDARNGLQGEVRTEEFSLATPALQTDVLRLDRLQGTCQASWQGDHFQIEKSAVDCDVGSASLAGAMSLGEKDAFSLDALSRQQYELSGRVDLARLARLLPSTLRLREQVAIDSGEVRLNFASRSESNGMRWRGQLDAAKLTATASGRRIAWERPMSVSLDAHQTAEGPIVDGLQCESDFLKVHASGTPDALAASLSFNLKQLADQLGQFVDLGSLQMAGEGWGNIHWKRTPEQEFTADAEIRMKNFALGLPDQPAWREEDLAALLAAKGKTNLGVETRIDSATVSIKAGAEQIDARLTKPVEDLRDGGVWPIHVQSQGQLQGWPGRLAAWLPMKDCQLMGGYALEIDGTASKQNVDVRQMRMAAEPLVATTPWVNMNEPRVDLTIRGGWNTAQRRLKIEPGSLICATAAVQANNFVLAVPSGGPVEMSGTLQYQGDAARLRGWLADPKKPPTWQIAGQLKGTVQLQQAKGVIHGETTTDVANLAVVDSSGQQFQEPQVRLVARGDYDTTGGIMQLGQFELASSALSANATGRMAPVGGKNEAQVNAQIGYDLERIAGLLRPYLGSGVAIAGRGASPASYRGPFSLAEGSAAAGFRWNWANVYGFRIGPAELKATMANGLVQIEPLDLAVSQGRMHLAPTIRLTSDPMELTLPKGPLAQQIQIDPRMCGSMLKYIAPVLADVTSAQGAFSIDMEGCRIPLSKPAEGELAGRVTIHSVEVGPGPLIRELAIFLGRETPAKLRRESVIQFRMVGGRVYHQGLDLEFPEFTIRTYGSVGLDQTLAIMAEMPVPPKWVEKNPMLSQAMRNQIIRVPINGTLSKPQLDKKVVDGLTRQFLQKAAENVIEGELNKQLDRLFGPRK